MPLTVGTNTYINATDADAYFAERLHADAWTKASAADREKALAAATAALDRLSFTGMIASTEQRLAWPRDRVRDREGRPVPSNTVPDAVHHAACEWALALLSPATTGAPVRFRQVGDLQVEYAATVADPVPPAVRAILAPFLRNSAADVELVF